MFAKRIGVVGLGRFGRLLCDLFGDDFPTVGHDPHVESAPLAEAAACDAVFFCVPMSRLEEALTAAAPHFAPGATVLDVCSVKLFALGVMRRLVPAGVRLLPTHPMFGPDSAAGGLAGLPFVLCPADRTPPAFLDGLSAYLQSRGLSVVTMTCDEHDRRAAYSLCLAQLLGRVLGRLDLEESPSDTRWFRRLLELRDVARNDSEELFRDMQTLNPYAAEMRHKVADNFDEICKGFGPWV